MKLLGKFNCNVCGSSFANRRNLKRHSDTGHLKKWPSRRHKCTKCEASFEKKEHLKHHLNSGHLNIKPYTVKIYHPNTWVPDLNLSFFLF